MNKALFLAMLCITSSCCLELERICSSDTFSHVGQTVNSFHRLERNVTFGSLSDYLIDEAVNCDLSEFKTKANFLETLKLKNE